jgi:hypothetical protein
LFLFFQALYALTSSGWVFRAPDEFEAYFETESLADRGSLAVPQTLSLEGGRSRFFGKLGGEGGRTPYAPYGPLVAFLALPHHVAARAVATLAGIDRERTAVAWRLVVSGLTALATSTAGALAVVGLFRGARALGASERRAIGLALVLGAATVLWPYAKSFFSEPFAAAAFAWSAALLLEARATNERRKLALASALLPVAILTKATNVVYAIPLALAPLLEGTLDRPRRIKASSVLGLGVALALLVHAQWNVHRFGNPFDFGYDWSETVRGPPRPFGGSLGRGLFVLLLSPGKSLVLWAPALALLAAARVRELARDRALALGVLGALAAGLLVFGKYMFPEGGYCHGPRHLVPIVPLLLLPAALGPAPGKRTFALALVSGVLLNASAVAVSYLEDQALGENFARHVYYEIDRDPGAGLPENRYALVYLPEVSLPRLALGSLGRVARGEAEPPGTGLDFFAGHLARARTTFAAPDGPAIPRALGPILALGASVILVLAACLIVRGLAP